MNQKMERILLEIVQALLWRCSPQFPTNKQQVNQRVYGSGFRAYTYTRQVSDQTFNPKP